MLARKSIGITQKDLAGKLGFKQANISRIESGEQQPTAEQLFAIAQALNTTVGALVGETVGLDVPPSTLAEFTAWCESRGFKPDKYLELGVWLLRHMDPSSLSAAMTAMSENAAKEFTLSDPQADEQAEAEAYRLAQEEVRKVQAQSGKRRKGAG